ncbi:unnamed protein product [Nezara viridula]|uniref:Uncharacterized protein n=1 Tax=Nezara viridula TaxID=85310 RepID=A0A9P0E0T1_NEZVI|nr:unnamed protein product [Nezara viridula]
MGATDSKPVDGGKQLVLRKKYRNGGEPSLTLPTDLNLQYTPVYQSPTTEYPEMSRRASQDSLFASITFRSPLTSPLTPSLPGTPLSDVFLPSPAFLGAPSTPISSSAPSVPPTTPVDIPAMQSSPFRTPPATPRDPPAPVSYPQDTPTADPPPVPPRRRSSELKLQQHLEEVNSENKENVEDGKISVKERSQKFDRMASEGALHKAAIHNKKRQEKADKDEEDGVTLFDTKSREWIVRCAQGDYQAIAKLAGDNPKLVKFKERGESVDFIRGQRPIGSGPAYSSPPADHYRLPAPQFKFPPPISHSLLPPPAHIHTSGKLLQFSQSPAAVNNNPSPLYPPHLF